MPLDLDELLRKTSRTFALAIPLLPEPTRRTVSVAYLLMRVADTFEDGVAWGRLERIDALTRLARALGPGREPLHAHVRRWVAHPPLEHAGYLELLGQLPELLAALEALPKPHRDVVEAQVVRMACGMAEHVARADALGNVRLGSEAELEQYCYVVAGLVGELLTAVFLLDAPQLAAEAGTLGRTERAFGEGLQLVNILKDSAQDRAAGRIFLPDTLGFAGALAKAKQDLHLAAEYVNALQRAGSPVGFVGFTSLALLLAFATLRQLEEKGPGAKVSRDEVARLSGQLFSQLAEGTAVDPLRLVASALASSSQRAA